MPSYRISSTTSGHTLGEYEGDTKAEALDTMARDAGYSSHADACEATGDDGEHLLVEELPEEPAATAMIVWIPALRKGAPSNRAGMAPGGPYRTRKEALEHEHWANQAAYATAKRVTVSDTSSFVDGFDGEELAFDVCRLDNTDAVAEALGAKRWASAIKLALGW